MLSDLRFAARRLRAAPLFVLFAVLTLGLGIGVTTATYSALYQTFWRSLGIEKNDSVFWVTAGSRQPRSISLPDLNDLRARQTAFRSLEATSEFPAAFFGNGRSALVAGEAVTGGYFSVLGVRPLHGRVLQHADDHPVATPVAVVSERLWRTHLGADMRALGRPVKIGGRLFELVGVAAPGFDGIARTPITDVWVPLSAAESVFSRLRGLTTSPSRNRAWLFGFGRLAPSHSRADAAAQVATIGLSLDTTDPITYRMGPDRVMNYPRAWTALRVGDRFSALDKQMTRAIMLVPALILLIACTNLTNLVLSRGATRGHEFALRRALGGSRFQLVREQMIEIGIIAIAGAAAGVATARVLMAMVNSLVTETFGFWPRMRIEFSLEPAVLWAVAGAALLALAVSGLAPALELTRATRSRALGVDSPGSAPPRWRGRANLIALQVAASIGLFLMSSFFVRQIMSVDIAKSGMTLDRAALVNVPFDAARVDEAATRLAVDRVLDELRRMPGIDRAAAGVLWDRPGRISIARAGTPDGRIRPDTYEYVPVTGGAFDVIGLRLRSGRTFYESDDAGSAPVAVVNDALALRIFGTPNVIGRELPVQLWIDRGGRADPEEKRLTVVGVAPDTYSRSGRVDSKIYVPLAQHFATEIDFIARSSSLSDESVALAVRTAVMKAAPEVPVGYAGPASVIEGFANTRMLSMMTTVTVSLATFALLLATGGLFGVLTHVMAQRQRELGIRAALGADRARIRNLVLKEGMRPVVEGAIIGFGAAGVMTLVAQPMFAKRLSGISVEGALLAALPLLAAAAIACYIPARRASRLDPSVCLRNE